LTGENKATKSGRWRWVMLSFSFIIAFLLHLLLFATAPMVTVIMSEMGLSHVGFGLVFSAAMVSLILFRVPWGLIGDRLGYVNAFRIALPISAISAVLRGFSTNYLTLLLSQFFLGVGLAVVLPCLPLLIKEWSPESLGLWTGIYISGFAVGNATALGLTPQMLGTLGWRSILLIYGVLGVMVSGLWCGLARSNVRGVSELKFKGFAKLLTDRYVWLLLLFMIASMGCYDTLATWMPKVLEMKGLDKVFASFLPLGFFLAGPVMGFTLDRFQNRKAMIALLGVAAAISITAINYASGPLLLACILISGFSCISALTISLTMPTKHKRLSTSVGSVVGFTSSLGNIGPLVMPVVFGFFIDATGAFQMSVFSVALLSSVTFIFGSVITE
jgi:ACS family D-galactonate transporter-like MFS transporter